MRIRQEGFDEHIELVYSGLFNLMEDVISLSRYFVEDNTNIVDIGCSTGKITEAMMSTIKTILLSKIYWVEVADGFEQDLKDRKKELNNAGFTNVEFIMEDIRNFKLKIVILLPLFLLYNLCQRKIEECYSKYLCMD